VLLEIKLILPVMQVMFLQYLLHHLRHRFIDEKTVAAKLFIQQEETAGGLSDRSTDLLNC
jgi:hypothetical protein